MEVGEKSPDWKLKIAEEVGKEFNILYSLLSEQETELLFENCPSVKDFVSAPHPGNPQTDIL